VPTSSSLYGAVPGPGPVRVRSDGVTGDGAHQNPIFLLFFMIHDYPPLFGLSRASLSGFALGLN